MSDDIILRAQSGSVPFADEDAAGASDPCASWITSKGSLTTNAEDEENVRNVRSFTTFRASGPPGIARRELPTPDDGAMLNRRESPQRRQARQSSVPRRDGTELESALQRYENAVLKYQKPKLRPKRQISRERQLQRQQQSNTCSSSDESVARNRSKSTSSIDTQSVNNILDEYEDLDYRRSSDLSDVGSISVTNFEAVMMDQQKRQQQQQQGRSRPSGAKPQIRSIPTREKMQPVLKVNQHTQVRQRSRDRQRESAAGKAHQHAASEDSRRVLSPMTADTAAEAARSSRMPEILLRKGEVQKRVDEWLSQAHCQNFPLSREKPLTRSNSSAEQKSQRRYRQDNSRSRSIDETKDRLNGASSSCDDLTRVDRKTERRLEKVHVGVNTSRATYKEYLSAVKSKGGKSQDYGFSVSSAAPSRSGDSSPASRIPQRGPLGSSFRSRRAERENPEESSLEERSARARITNLAKTRSGESDYGCRATVGSSKVAEMSTVTTSAVSTSMIATTTTTTSIIPCRRPSLKRSGNGDQNAARSLVKEEMEQRARGACGAGPSKGPSAGSLGDQGEPISPNKDGESRRPAAASGPTRPADKAVEALCCKSTEAPRCVDHPRGESASRIAASAESGIAAESRSRRLQTTDVRKESRIIDQSRQESSIYGAVGARVRALQGQGESRSPRTRCHQQIGAAAMEVRKPPVLPRKDHGVSREVDSQDRTKASCVMVGAPSSSFKPNNRIYIATGLHQLNEQNVARSKIATCEPAPGRTRLVPTEHVERIYERSLQPQVIHVDDLESIPRPSLQTSAYGEETTGEEDQESPDEENESTENELFERIGGEPRHEHLETIEEDDRKSEGSICKYPEIGLKQCLKVQQSLVNGRSKEAANKKKDPSIHSSIYAKWERQAVFNEPDRIFASTFHQSTSPCQANIVKSNVQSRSAELKEFKDYEEQIRQDPEPAMTLEDLVAGYQEVSREEQDRLTMHSRENSNLSTATIPIDELESQQGSRFKADEDSTRNKIQLDEKSQGYVVEEPKNQDAEERGAVVNEILVKNLQFEQDLPENLQGEQTRVDHVVQQVNFHNILCDDYENDDRLKDQKLYMTKEEADHQRLITMLKKGDLEMLKMVSLQDYLVSYQREFAGSSPKKILIGG